MLASPVISEIAININFFRHIPINLCHVILNLNFSYFATATLWRFALVWSERVMESLPPNNFVKHSLYIVAL